jgi:DNA-directed RNA polymerase subunit RPC12/RpoP
MFEAPGTTTTTDRPEMQDGEDFVCPNCGCEIMLKHHGDPGRMVNMTQFTCCCGTKMEPEHPRQQRR